MINTKLSMTAQAPSAFGMPISGPALGAIEACSAAALVAHDRVAVAGTSAVTGAFDGAVTGDLRLAPADVQGTSAWRPPIC